MHSSRFRPSLTTLESRENPSITPGQVFEAAYNVDWSQDALRNLMENADYPFDQTFYTLFQQVLPQIADQNRASEAILAEFQMQLQLEMGQNPASVGTLGVYLDKVVQLRQSAGVNAIYADFFAARFGAPPRTTPTPTTPTDGGTTPTDGGSTPTDGGSTPTDGGSTPTDGGSTPTEAPPLSTTIPTVQGTPDANGLIIQDLFVGSGATAKVGDTITFDYIGFKVSDGSVLDSSQIQGQPLQSVLASGSLIQGFVQGVPGMQVGGVRRIYIPSALAYNNGDLVFEVKLNSIP